MKAQADKTVSIKSKAAANMASVTHETEVSEVLFEDKRPEVVAQKQLAEKADSSPQAGKIAQLQAHANDIRMTPVQAKGSMKLNDATSQEKVANNPGRQVVQLGKRKHLPDDRTDPAAVVPDLKMESYGTHVGDRTLRFFQQVLGAAKMILDHDGGTLRKTLFSDNAEVQVQKGKRQKTSGSMIKGEGDFDAAHIMNTSLNWEEYAAETGQDSDSEDVQSRLLASAATVNQFQRSNVSADKLIDAQQTSSKNEMLGQLADGSSLDEKFIEGHVNKYLDNLLNKIGDKVDITQSISGTDIKIDSYIKAHNVLQLQKMNIGRLLNDINAELET